MQFSDFNKKLAIVESSSFGFLLALHEALRSVPEPIFVFSMIMEPCLSDFVTADIDQSCVAITQELTDQ